MKLNNPSLLLQTAFSMAARFAGVGLNFAVAFIITHNLPMNEAGMLFMLMTLVTGVSLFSRLGVEQWIVRDVAGLPEEGLPQAQANHLYSAYRMMAFSTLAFMLLWLLASSAIKQTLFDGEIRIELLWLAASGILFFNLVMTNSAFMKAAHLISESLLIQNALPAITTILMIGLCWPIMTTEQNYLWIYTAAMVLAGIVSFLWLRPWWAELRSPGTPQPLREVLKKSLPLAPVSFFAFLMLWTDTLMTGLLLSNEDVALYTIAARLSFVSAFFLGALDATIYPRLLRIHKRNPEQLKKFFWQATLMLATIIGTVTLILIVVGKPVLALFGSAYTQAAPTLILLLLAQLVRGLSLTFSFMFIIQQQVRYLNILLFVALIVNIIANLVFIPNYGIEGAAGATLIANLTLTGGVALLFLKKRLLSDYD